VHWEDINYLPGPIDLPVSRYYWKQLEVNKQHEMKITAAR